MVTKTMQSGAHLTYYVYRFGDKLKRYASTFPDDATSGSNMYDGFGRRRNVYSIQGALTKTVWWRYAGWSPISEHEENPEPTYDWVVGARTRTYIPGLAQVNGSNPSTGTYQYFQTDHLGSVRSIRGQDKALLASYEYSPYGEPYHFSGQPLNIGYTGHMWDSISGMYWTPYRYYMPGNGGWNMRDPIGLLGGINHFSYVGNSPITNVDPSGLFWNVVLVMAGGLIVGGILGGLDQAGCEWPSIFHGALLGGLTTAAAAGAASFGFWPGLLAGVLAGTVDGGIRNGVVGAVAGGIGGGLVTGAVGGLALRPNWNWLDDLLAGMDIALGLQVGAGVDGNRPGENCLGR